MFQNYFIDRLSSFFLQNSGDLQSKLNRHPGVQVRVFVIRMKKEKFYLAAYKEQILQFLFDCRQLIPHIPSNMDYIPEKCVIYVNI